MNEELHERIHRANDARYEELKRELEELRGDRADLCKEIIALQERIAALESGQLSK